ncbi:MAG: hypothetical protein RMI94_02040 [Bryobacterales bacterium]|nr:hypothetical protein [Bryobacterales bacterium]
MIKSNPEWELIVLEPDKNTQKSLQPFLTRRRDLGIRPDLKYQVLTHPFRDPAVLHECHAFPRASLRCAARALALFDHEGSKREQAARTGIEAAVQARLDANG